MFLDNTPDNDQPGKWNAYFSSHSNQVRNVVGAYLWVAAGIALLAFFVVLRERLNGRMDTFSFAAGAIASAALCIGGGISGTVGGTILFGDSPAPSGEVAEFVASTAYPVLLLSAMFPLAVSLISMGVVVLRSHALPVWMGCFTMVMGVLLLGSVVWLPLFAAPLFGIVIGIALAVRHVEGASLAAPAPA